MNNRVSFRYAWPSADLRGHIFVFWEVEIKGDVPVTDLLLPYWATVRIPISGDWHFGDTRETLTSVGTAPVFHGLTSEAQWIGGHGRAFCIVLFPLVWQGFRGHRASQFADRLRPLPDLMGDAAAPFRAMIADAPDFETRVALASAWFSGRVAQSRAHPLASAIGAMMKALPDPDVDSVEALARRVGLSQPQLARLSADFFGFPPKLMLRRERFLRMLFTMERRPYAEWRDFIDQQYVDQSHMIRDFKHFTGLSPNQYFDLDRPILSVAAEEIKRFLQQSVDPVHPTAQRINSDP